jgi:small subunit ribosomal protein S16
VAVKIKLKRVGKVHAPQYRVVVADSRTARNGRAIEEIGIYQPLEDPSIIRVDSERVQYWLGVGAQPTEAVAAILKVTGDWQKFKGEPGAEGTLQVAEPKADKKVVYETAVKEAASEPKTPAPAKAKPKEDAVSEEAAEEPAAQAPEEAAAPVGAPADAPAEAPAEEPAAEAAEEAADAPADAPAEESAAEAAEAPSAEASAEEASE